MRQIVIRRGGKVDVLEVQETDKPQPQKSEVLIEVKAAGLNFADILARQGRYMDAPPTPCVVGYEVSGIVESVGEGMDESLLNQEVFALTRFGGQAEYVTVPVTQVFGKPSTLTFEQAAAIPINYLTAYALLVVMGSLHEGESILIHNVGGGVGLAALEIAKKIGAVTYGTASGHKHDFLQQRGLDHAIDYRTQDWTTILKDLTNGRGVDLIIDPIGGSHWKKSYNALRMTGRLGMFGVSVASGTGFGGKLHLLWAVLQASWYNPIGLINKNKGVFGLNLGQLWDEGEKVRDWMHALIEGVQDGWISPHIDQTFSFDQVAEAHTHIENRQNIGKVIFVP